MSHSSRGIGKLPPCLRLLVVISCGSLYILISNVWIALVFFLFGLILVAFSDKPNWKLATSSPFSGGMMFLYNAILSPPAHGGFHWLFITINSVGIQRGLVTGFRLSGAMFVSFAWLFSTSIPEIYEGISWFKPGRDWTLGILRGIQIISREFVALTQSLLIRGLRWSSLWANIKNLLPLSMAIVPRVIENTQKSALALRLHFPGLPKDCGTIDTEGVFVRYGPTLSDVLKGVNLQVEKGEFVYLAGVSGAGKTTLLRVFGGVIPWIMGESTGTVSVSGMVTHETSLARLCGTARFVAAEPFASIYGLTVSQEISFLAGSEVEAQRALAVMGIESLWDRETTKLSGGQQVRLVLAGALVSRAPILLLDSPTQELDPQGRADFLEALTALRSQRECTIVVADPFWPEFQTFVNRVVVLEKGNLVVDIEPTEFVRSNWLRRCHLSDPNFEIPDLTPGNTVGSMENVHVKLDGQSVLNGINFSVREGELVAVVGANGSGKTTAMLTLCGAIAPYRGNVKVTGHSAYVFQHAELQIVAPTVGEELALGPKILGWTAKHINQFVEQGLLWTGLSSGTCPLDLHPAEVRMLAIAACNTDAQVLILDEPTVSLDCLGIEKVMNLVAILLQQGKGVVIITHDQQIARVAHRVVTINNGKIVNEQQRRPD